MKGAGNHRETRDARVPRDELTRRGPIPLTVKRPAGTPTPVEFADDVPVVASEDVDLGTPAPLPFPISPNRSSPSRGDTPMNALPPPGRYPTGSRGPSPSRPYIRPTPTFSFDDGPEAGMWAPPQPRRRRRSGAGLFGITILMLLAGLAGYFTVKYRAWQDVGPIVARATELVRSLRSTFAPTPAPEASTSAPAPTPSTPPSSPAATGSAPPSAAPAPQALRPEVVPIAPPSSAAPSSSSAERGSRRSSSRHHRRSLKPLSPEAAAEEALLAEPSRER
jgi:hypothetical protein